MLICVVVASTLQFFGEAGFPCPSRRNPSDHFLRCVNSDFDNVTAALVESRRINVCFPLPFLFFHELTILSSF